MEVYKVVRIFSEGIRKKDKEKWDLFQKDEPFRKIFSAVKDIITRSKAGINGIIWWSIFSKMHIYDKENSNLCDILLWAIKIISTLEYMYPLEKVLVVTIKTYVCNILSENLDASNQIYEILDVYKIVEPVYINEFYKITMDYEKMTDDNGPPSKKAKVEDIRRKLKFHPKTKIEEGSYELIVNYPFDKKAQILLAYNLSVEILKMYLPPEIFPLPEKLENFRFNISDLKSVEQYLYSLASHLGSKKENFYLSSNILNTYIYFSNLKITDKRIAEIVNFSIEQFRTL